MIIKNTITGRFPLVVHAPDLESNEIWKNLYDCFFHLSCCPAKLSDDLTIITWNNLETSPLEKCLQFKSIPYKVLGKDLLIWNNLEKFKLNILALSKIKTKYVMGLDSHDVLVLGSPLDIVKKFETMNCDLLFNSETYFYPDLAKEYYIIAKKFQDKVGNGKYRYLNSGAWIGKLDYCKFFFEKCIGIRIWELFDCSDCLKLFNCDQSVVHSIFMQCHPRVMLDYNCEIFCNLARTEKKEIVTMVKNI